MEKQEIDQLNIELKETQRRLKLAENSFDTSQGELLRVTNQLNKCKQEVRGHCALYLKFYV